MLDRLYLPALALASLAAIALALVWPQGLGARSPAPFGHPVAQAAPAAPQTPAQQQAAAAERALAAKARAAVEALKRQQSAPPAK